MQLSSKLEFTATVLAGGKSTRLERHKCLLHLNGEKLIEILLKKLNALFENILIVTNFPELYFYLGYPLIGDLYPFRGPMAGIHAAMKNSEYDIFAFACDMPNIGEKIIKKIAEEHLLEKSKITVCSFQGKLYPLPGIYSKEIMPYLEELLLEEKLSMTKLIQDVNAKIIEVANLDEEGLSFINVNTKEDFEKLRKGGIICSD